MHKELALLSGLRSDSHTWALAYLQVWLEERGFDVLNLGSCMPIDELIDVCRESGAELVVLSSVNGHAAIEACETIAAFRAADLLERVQVTIGGKLATSTESERAVKEACLAAGYAGVFIGPDAIDEFATFLEQRGAELRTQASGASK